MKAKEVASSLEALAKEHAEEKPTCSNCPGCQNKLKVKAQEILSRRDPEVDLTPADVAEFIGRATFAYVHDLVFAS